MEGKYDQNKCDVCNNEEETQKHIFTCKDIVRRIKDVKDNEVIDDIIEYDDINGDNVRKQIKVAQIMNKHMKVKHVVIKERQLK